MNILKKHANNEKGFHFVFFKPSEKCMMNEYIDYRRVSVEVLFGHVPFVSGQSDGRYVPFQTGDEIMACLSQVSIGLDRVRVGKSGRDQVHLTVIGRIPLRLGHVI